MSGHSYYTDCHKGRYNLIHPEKYLPNLALPEYKSSWEEKVFILCDVNPFVVKWGYEPFDIAYHSPLYMKQSIYKPDIYLECRYPDGREEKCLMEIKPVAYSVVPKAPKMPAGCTDPRKIASYQKRKKSYDRKMMDVMVNYAKWEAAEAWCRRNGMRWFIANEKNTLGLFNASSVI